MVPASDLQKQNKELNMKVMNSVRRLAFASAVGVMVCASNASALSVPRPAASGITTSVGYVKYVALSWNGVSGANKYYIFRSTSSKFSKRVKIKAVSKKTRTFRDTTAKPGVTYWYWVCPVSKPSWRNGWRSTYYYNTKKFVRGCRALSAPKPTASYNTYSSYIKLTWAAVPYAKKYKIMRSTSSSYYYATQLAVTTSRTYYDTSATPGTTYYYWILPAGKNGKFWYNSSKYDYGKRKSSVLTPPDFTVYRYSYYVYISWNSVPGAAKYYIFKYSTSTPPSSFWNSSNAGATTSNTYIYDYNLDYGDVWYYWVCPVNSSGKWWYNSSRYAYGYLQD